MSRLVFILTIVLLLSVAAPGVCQKRQTFGIYMIAGAVDARVFAHGSEQWKTLPLRSEPIISDEDIVAYDFSKHAIKLTAEAFNRLPRPSVAGIPFVVVGNGERIYPGAFYTSLSSIPCDVPVIVTDGIRVNKPVEPNTIFIEPAYPKSRAHGKDSRSDERLRAIFAALNKLTARNGGNDRPSLTSDASNGAQSDLRVIVPVGTNTSNAHRGSQEPRSEISGRITDPNGAVVPGAIITITSRSSQTWAYGKSNPDGTYAVDLQPDSYDITVASPGFKTAEHESVSVVRASRAHVDFVLQVGEVGSPRRILPSPGSAYANWLESKSTHYTVFFQGGYENDVPFVRKWMDRAEQLMKQKYGVTTDHYRVSVYLYPEPAPAEELDINRSAFNYCCGMTESGMHTGEIELLTISAPAWRANLKSSLGLRKSGEDYHAKVLTSEYIPIGHYAVQDSRGEDGWRYYSAPNWFVQGLQEYDAIFHSTDYNRVNTSKRLYEWAKHNPDRFSCCAPQLKINDDYNGGAVFLSFLAEQFGEGIHARILRSRAPTFDLALATETKPYSLVELFELFRKWLDHKQL
jgi:hypothetical protein